MSNPYHTLSLHPGATDEEIRRRYLQLVREFPPERAPERFAEIRAAYDELRDPRKSVARRIFGLDCAETLDDILADARNRALRRRVPTQLLLSLAEA